MLILLFLDLIRMQITSLPYFKVPINIPISMSPRFIFGSTFLISTYQSLANGKVFRLKIAFGVPKYSPPVILCAKWLVNYPITTY